jgi:hypothetical protein
MNIELLKKGDLVEPNQYARQNFKFPKDMVLPWKVVRVTKTNRGVVMVERCSRKNNRPYYNYWAVKFLKFSTSSHVKEETRSKE